MPRKYLRIARRRTCVTPALQEKENDTQRFQPEPLHFLFCIDILYFCLASEIGENVTDQGNDQKDPIRNGNGSDQIAVYIREENKQRQTDEQDCGTDFACLQGTRQHFPPLKVKNAQA